MEAISGITITQFNVTKRRIAKALKKYKSLLGLGTWTLDVVYHALGHDEDFSSETKSGTIHATCVAHWEYRRADIKFNVYQFVELPDYKVEDTVKHELLHCLVNQMRAWRSSDGEKIEQEHEEAVVTSLEQAFNYVEHAGYLRGKKEAMKQKPKKKKAKRK